MKQLVPIYCCTLLLSVTTGCFAQQNGETLFNSFCNACHSIGKGRLVGPDLAGVHERRSSAWLVKFIQSSQSMIRDGDPEAVALFSEYNQTVMPDAPYNIDEIKSILAYIAEKSSPGAEAVSASSPSGAVGSAESSRSVEEADDREINMGLMLFSGKVRLGGDGPSCMSCHHVKNDRLIGGGSLAKDLTSAFSRMNESGIRAIVGNPPFPAMKEAYAGAPITDEEVYALTAFLKYADEQQYNQHPSHYQRYMLEAGALGLAILLTAFSLIWRSRRRNVVNHRIFSRQVKSESSIHF